MMRSMYSAVSGLKTHQTKMDVIGNNIANVNTVAFKSSSVVFQDVLYQMTSNASGANAATGTGGVNAKQIGLGVTTGATNLSITLPVRLKQPDVHSISVYQTSLRQTFL